MRVQGKNRPWKACFGALLLCACALAAPGQDAAQLPYRWVFSFGYGRNRRDVDRIKGLIDTAAAHGLNGMVLFSFGLDRVTPWRDKDIALLKEIAAHCDRKGIELIPTGCSLGYSGDARGQRHPRRLLSRRDAGLVVGGVLLPRL